MATSTFVLVPTFNRDKALIAQRAPVVRYDDVAGSWPARPAATVVVWSGGPSQPPASTDGDFWIP